MTEIMQTWLKRAIMSAPMTRQRTGMLVLVGATLIAASSAGVSVGAGTPPTAIPAVSHVRLSPNKFRAALTPTPGFGATVHYRLSENAVQTFVVKQHIGKHWVTLKGTFVKRGRQGKDVFPFPGILHGHKLHKGHYVLIVTPALDGVGTGKPVIARFTVTG
jgi:hypothetical protein